MDKFIASARKYRPSTFNAVIGQKHITDTLINSIKSERFSQSYLFTGPRGIGKTTCARILAKALNCLNRTAEGEPCNNCDSCNSFNQSASFNIYEIDAASNSHVEDIRALIDQVRFPPQSGKFKTYIIDEVHMLSQSAFNAFLKTLEEPPPYAIFILATTEKHKIIPTILSRCQIFDFYRISVEDITSHLEKISKEEKVKAERDALHIIAQKSDGSLRDALSIFDKLVSFSNENITYQTVIDQLNILDYEYFFDTTEAFVSEDTARILNLFNDITSKGFEGDDFLLGLTEHIRNLMIAKDPQTIGLLDVTEGLKEQYENQAQTLSNSFLVTILNLANECDVNYKLSKNKRLHVEIALIKMCYINAKLSASSTVKTSVQPKQEPIEAKKKPEELSIDPLGQTIPNKSEEAKEDTAKGLETNEPLPDFKFTSKSEAIVDDSSQAEEAASSEEATVVAIPNEKPLEEKALAEAWKAYALTLKEDGQDYLYSLMNTIHPQVISEDRFQITIENQVLQTKLTEQKTYLLEFFKKKLDLNTIQMDILVNKELQQVKNLLYTDRDKFNRMAEKNPKLLELKKRFGLEIDF
ncbi:MAG: DNA polymerase III subunit gamma/tau [Bacteroidetes bacterium]|nr:DNA polymerase III subunit gamma/tau [Bacteroidota bacterium]